MPEFERMVNDQWTPLERIGEFVVKLAIGDADALSGRFLRITQDLVELAQRAEEIQKQDLFTLRLRQ